MQTPDSAPTGSAPSSEAINEHMATQQELRSFTRKEWVSSFGQNVPLKPLNRSDIDVLGRLAGTNEVLSSLEIKHIYYPLAGLILQQFQQMRSQTPAKNLFILGISGSVAVGKSTGARVLTELLRREALPVELITTDNFLKPNHQLEAEGLLRRKGFPESYDQNIIQTFLSDLQQEKPVLRIPTYDHIAYTILPDAEQEIYRPALLVLEGVNVLQNKIFPLDFTLYFDAEEQAIRRWYTQRFLLFRNRAFARPGAYFERYATLTDEQATQVAHDLWDSINHVNLQTHILPSRENAQCVLFKNAHHKVEQIQLKLKPV